MDLYAYDSQVDPLTVLIKLDSRVQAVKTEQENYVIGRAGTFWNKVVPRYLRTGWLGPGHPEGIPNESDHFADWLKFWYPNDVPAYQGSFEELDITYNSKLKDVPLLSSLLTGRLSAVDKIPLNSEEAFNTDKFWQLHRSDESKLIYLEKAYTKIISRSQLDLSSSDPSKLIFR